MVFYDYALGVTRTMPSPMDTKGRYVWNTPEILRRNGEGVAVIAGFASVVWTFTALRLADYQWWTITLLQRQASRQFGNGTTLVDHNGNNIIVKSCVVEMPTYDYASNGWCNNVTVNIKRIIT